MVFDVGDEELINVKRANRPTLQRQGQPMPHYAGPFKVPKQIYTNTFEAQISQPATGNRRHRDFHASQLKRFNAKDTR